MNPKPASSNASTRRTRKGQTATAKKQQRGAIGKLKRFQWTESDMRAAVEGVSSGGMTQRQAAQQFSVPRATLQKILNGKTEIGTKPGKKPLFGAALETKLVDYAANRAALGIGFGKRQFLDYAGQLAKKHKVALKNAKPSEKWWRLMKKRNSNVRLRRPEGTAAVRHMCMDKVKVEKYFFALRELFEKRGLMNSPDCIWNMDETGLQLEHKPRTVVARKGAKYLQSRTSGNKETITVIACISASGKKIPPHIIAKGKTERALHGFDLKSAPAGAKWSVSTKGWTKQGIARLWFESTFLPNIGPERPQVLILDGHDSHNFVELIELAIANRIEIVELPAHTSNWLQPCDRTVFKPLKDAYGEVCQTLMNEYAGVVISKANFCGLLSKAWERALTADNIKSGFKACGIYPLNPNQIPVQAYMPNMLYTIERDPTESELAVDADKSVPVVDTPSVATICPAVPVTDVSGKTVQTTMTSDDNQNIQQEAESIDSEYILSASDIVQLHAVVDLPMDLDDVTGPSTEQDMTERPCGIRMALRAVESSFSERQLEIYRNAHSSGDDNRLQFDRLYLTWKGLKDAENDEEVIRMQNVSVTSVDTVLLEAVMNAEDGATANAVQDTNFEDVEKMLEEHETTVTTGLASGVSQTFEDLTEIVSAEAKISFSTPQRPVLMELFPFQNTSSPVDLDSDVLPYPKPQIRKKKINSKKPADKFFVLTSDEAYQSKLSEQAAKIAREKEKDEKQRKLKEEKELLAKQKELKAGKKTAKRKSTASDPGNENIKKSKKSGKSQQKKKEENWQCESCKGLYFDAGHPKYQEDWVECVECHKKQFHNSCAIDHGRFDNDDINGDFTCACCVLA